MKALTLIAALLVSSTAAAQESTFQPQPVGPMRPVPVQPYAQYQLYQVSPIQYQPMYPVQRQPRCCRPRGTWGIWPIPVPLGYYY